MAHSFTFESVLGPSRPIRQYVHMLLSFAVDGPGSPEEPCLQDITTLSTLLARLQSEPVVKHMPGDRTASTFSSLSTWQTATSSTTCSPEHPGCCGLPGSPY